MPSGAKFRIETLGSVKLIDLSRDEALPLRSNGRLVAYLAVRAPAVVSRKTLVSEIWPDVPTAIGLNRLRVAISKLRQIIPSVLVVAGDGLSIDPESVECDAWEFLELVKGAGDTMRVEDELAALYEAAQFFTRNAAAGKLEGWDSGVLSHVLSAYHDACLRIGELALNLRRESLIVQSRASLTFFPHDAVLWSQYLQASLNLGNGEAAVKELAATKDKTLLANKDLRQLIELILNRGRPDEDIFSSEEAKVAAEVVKAVVTSRKELARAILCSPETLSLAGSNPRAMLGLLERVVADPLPGDEHWERCMARICGLKAWLGDSDGVFEYGSQITAHSSNPVILRATWNAISLAHSFRREWTEAMCAIETTIGYAKQTGNEVDVLSGEGNRASYLWQQCRFEESEREYDRILARVKEIGTPQAEFEYVIGFGNRAFIPVMQADWPRALRLIEESQEMRVGALKVPMGLLLPCLGMVRMALGEPSGVFRLVRQGFFDANESGSERMQQITFEFAACALGFTDHWDFGKAVLDWVRDWRVRTKLPRAAAEEQLCRAVFGSRTAPALRQDETPSTVGREVLRRLRLATRG